ncbi:MAG: DUF459 domain-containing protein [Nannocystaceae bacterium]
MSRSVWRGVVWRSWAWRPTALGALGSALITLMMGSAACKPEAPAAAQVPDQGSAVTDPAPAADPSPAADGAMLAGGTPAVDDPDALDPPAAEPSVAAAEPVPEADPPEPAIPEEPYRVLILGDSLAATGIGALLEKKLDAHPNVLCYRKGKSSSGLARPDFFDWPDQAKRQIEFRKPNLVVVIIGGNDGQDLTRRSNGQGKRVNWDHDDWPAAYRERVDGFLEEIVADGRKVLWLGLPTMGMRSLEKKLTLIRGIQKEAVDALGDDGTYLETAPFVTNEAGDLLSQAKVGVRGKLQTIRAEDRIHFTMAGSEYFADLVYPSVLEALGLPDVQPDP